MKIKAIEDTSLLSVGELLAKGNAHFQLASDKAETFEFKSVKGKRMTFAQAPVRVVGECLDVLNQKVSHASVSLPTASSQAFFRDMEEGDEFTCTIGIDPKKTGNNKSDYDRNSFSEFKKVDKSQ